MADDKWQYYCCCGELLQDCNTYLLVGRLGKYYCYEVSGTYPQHRALAVLQSSCSRLSDSEHNSHYIYSG